MPIDNAPESRSAAPSAKKRRRVRSSVRLTQAGPVLDLERYVPGLFTLVTSRLSGGASAAYLALYAVGIETWRVMVMLALEGRVTAQRIVKLLDADKGAVSRTFKTMHEQGLLQFEPDAHDRRIRHATMTRRGRELHDRILRLALLREETALSVLSADEIATLRDMLGRIHANLPQVESVTGDFIRAEREVLGMASNAPALRRRGSQPVEAVKVRSRPVRSRP